jgi:outer membrane protein
LKKALIGALCLLAPVAGFTLELETALTNLTTVNPQVRASFAEVRAARAQERSSFGAMLPTITATASFSDEWQDANGTSSEATPRTYGVNGSYPLFSGGSLMADQRAAKAYKKLTEAQFANTWQTQALALVQAYLNTLHDEEVLALYEHQVTVLGEQLKATERRFEVGEVTKTDVAQATARLAGAKARRAAAQGQLLATRAQFQAIYGELPHDLNWPDVPEMTVTALDELEPVALRHHPRIEEAYQLRRQRGAQVRSEQGAFLPEVTVDASWSKTNGALNATNGAPAEATSVGLNASLPIFQGGKRVNDVAAAQHLRQAAIEALDGARRTTQAELIEAYYNRNAASLAYEALSASVEANELATQGVRREGEVGERSVLDVLDAEQELLSAKVDLTAARRDYIVADYALQAALGSLVRTTLGEDYAKLFKNKLSE